MTSLVDRVIRRLNWGRRNWSTTRDREFHDAVFAGQTYDPFSASYPGYLTIRRFADLAAHYVQPGDEVFDLGCGPGEITCELARRLPESRFVGIDHSTTAISRGQELAGRLGLMNVRFEYRDLEDYRPPHRVGLVTMFDAFHHVLEPAGFVERVGASTDRFFLIEPAGNRFGQWEKAIDLDWLAEALFVIRDRLEYTFGLNALAVGASAPAPPAGEPTEHRYSLEDFTRWFAGYGLEVYGTIAGLERHGTSPYLAGPVRDDIGRTLYTLVVELEGTLRRADLDLAAKHWAIYAERGRTFPVRTAPMVPQRTVDRTVGGPYDVEYDAYQGPDTAPAGTVVDASVRIVNRGWRLWDSFGADGPVFLSYHWHDASNAMVVEDGLRSPLPNSVAQNEGCTVTFRIQCPVVPGRYTLAIDLVHEHVTWFSRAGAPPLRVSFRVL